MSDDCKGDTQYPTLAGALSSQAPQRHTVLAVDDTPANLNLLAQLLGHQYRVQLAVSGTKALELALRKPPDLIVLDVMMPDIDGYEVCRRLKAERSTRDVPVIFLTALNGPDDETRAFEVGGADYVAKPFTPATLRARVHTHLELKCWRDTLTSRNTWLQNELDRRLLEVESLRETTLYMMVSLAEFRDESTANHLLRTQAYVQELALWLQQQGLLPDEMDGDQIDAMIKAAPLHDIGKVAIPDHVLLKPGPLDAQEWAVMKTHAEAGARLLQRAVDRLGDGAGPLLHYAIQIARHHHERWDGSGYPDGLAGEDIPLCARMMAVVDVYDALMSQRPYKQALTHEQAMERIQRDAGSHFDPLLARALAAVQPQLRAIAEQWRD